MFFLFLFARNLEIVFFIFGGRFPHRTGLTDLLLGWLAAGSSLVWWLGWLAPVCRAGAAFGFLLWCSFARTLFAT